MMQSSQGLLRRRTKPSSSGVSLPMTSILSIQQVLGDDELAQQERGELYVAVAEVNGAPVGRRCLNFTWYQHIGAGYCYATGIQARIAIARHRRGIQ